MSAPTPADILRVTLRPELMEAAEHYIRRNQPIDWAGWGRRPIRWKRTLRTYNHVAAMCIVTKSDLRLAVRVIRHLHQQKQQDAA